MTSDDFWWFSTHLPTMSNDFYPIMSNFLWSLWTPLPALKSDFINGHSLMKKVWLVFFPIEVIILISGGPKTFLFRFCFCFSFQEKTETETKQWSIRMIWLCFGFVSVLFRFCFGSVSVRFQSGFALYMCTESFWFRFSFGFASKTETHW